MASHHGVAEQFQRSNLAALEDPQLAELLIRGISDASSLSDVDRLRVDLYLLSIFRTYEEVYALHRKGLVDDELWDSREESMMRWMSYPGVRSWWRGSQVHNFIASFRVYIDSRLSESIAQQGGEPDVE